MENNLPALINNSGSSNSVSLKNNDVEIFDGIKLTDFYKQSYQGYKSNQERIAELITNLSSLVRTTTDAIALVPLISSYLENNNKNDENLVKLVTLIQKHALFELENVVLPDTSVGTNAAGVPILSDSTKEEIRKQLNMLRNIDKGVDKAIDKAQQTIKNKIIENKVIDIDSEEVKMGGE